MKRICLIIITVTLVLSFSCCKHSGGEVAQYAPEEELSEENNALEGDSLVETAESMAKDFAVPGSQEDGSEAVKTFEGPGNSSEQITREIEYMRRYFKALHTIVDKNNEELNPQKYDSVLTNKPREVQVLSVMRFDRKMYVLMQYSENIYESFARKLKDFKQNPGNIDVSTFDEGIKKMQQEAELCRGYKRNCISAFSQLANEYKNSFGPLDKSLFSADDAELKQSIQKECENFFPDMIGDLSAITSKY